MKMTVLRGGMLTTVQDGGRLGYQSQGFSVGGAMDKRALRIGNLLLGNPQDTAGLEVTMIGPEIRFEGFGTIALTGGCFDAELAGEPATPYRALQVAKDDVLRIDGARSGTRCYITFAGGLRVPEVMGSRSTSLRCGIGGYRGRKLQPGDILETGRAGWLPRVDRRSIPAPEYDPETEIAVIRVIPGPQDFLFTPEGIETFYGQEYRISGKSDRMGYRLEGPAIAMKGSADILSDGTAEGAIQVSSSGQPIVLLADRQTTGGYGKIATVISVDLPRLVQLGPGRKVRFQAVSVEKAQALVREEAAELERLRRKFRRIF